MPSASCFFWPGPSGVGRGQGWWKGSWSCPEDVPELELGNEGTRVLSFPSPSSPGTPPQAARDLPVGEATAEPERSQSQIPLGSFSNRTGRLWRPVRFENEPYETAGRTLVVVVKVPAVRAASRDVKSKKNRRPRGRERWLRWKAMLDDGVYESRSALARGEGVSPAAVTQGLRRLAGESDE